MKSAYKPFVSVIIPTFNSAEFIEEAINSVLNQSYQNFEIIVVDDSSLDRTVDIVSELSKNESRISLYKIEHAGRPSVPRNVGINNAKGELVAFLDSDDVWTKDKLEEQIKYFNKYPNLIFVYSMSVTFGLTNIFSNNFEVLPLLFKAAKSREELIKKGNSITCSSVVVKLTALNRVNGFDEDPQLKAVEDYDLWIRLSELDDFYFIPRILVKYRIHGTQTSSDLKSKQDRLMYLANKRKLNLPKYKFYSNKGLFFKIVRNTVHILNLAWIKLLSYLSKI